MNSPSGASVTTPNREFLSLNPVTGDLMGAYPFLDDQLLMDKVSASRQVYYEFWQQTSLDERIQYIKKVGEELETNLEHYATLITVEMGKPITEAMAEVKKCVLLCQHFAAKAPTYLADVQTSPKSFTTYQPIGAVLGVMPWNYPFWQVLRFAIPTLLVGNVVFLKHAPNVPQCGLALESILFKAIGRPHIFTNLFIDENQVATLIDHEFIAGVTLTGSDRAGAAVAQKAGQSIVKCVLELGGSDAFIVLDDADVEKAAATAAISRMKNAGQTCISAKRLIVDESIADPFILKLKEEMLSFKMGNPMETSTELSSLARKDLQLNLERQVKASVEMGAKVILDGGIVEGPGHYFKPMIVTNVVPGMPLYDEEVFGPVATVFVVENEASAIALANDTRYGLGAAVWSQSQERAIRVAKKVEAGGVAINDGLRSRPNLPFGGIKKSGFGKEMGRAGMLEFANAKSIVIL